MLELLQYPFDPPSLNRKRRELKRNLLGREDVKPLRVALMGRATTSEIADFLQLFLLRAGLSPVYYDAPFGQYYEEIVHHPEALTDFAADVVVLHLGLEDIQSWPTGQDDYGECLESELARLQQLWSALRQRLSCTVIQSNFPLPCLRSSGNLDGCDYRGGGRFILDLNARLAQALGHDSHVRLNDVHFLSSSIGLENYFSRKLWHSYRIRESLAGSVHLAHSLAAIIRATYGLVGKCLVLDLDNTLWGGVIGEEGLEGIVLGADDPVGEAYVDFQRYLKGLRARGVLLAICSKNDEARGLAGFDHPDSVLRLDDFSAYRVNWQPKNLNLVEMAEELSLGLNSFVFVDDNPAEREIVRTFLPQVAVPEVGDDITEYSRIIDGGRYFESVSLSQDDLQRSNYYAQERQRAQASQQFQSHQEFLSSLEMQAEIRPFSSVYVERIAQLSNKTNQFNLTTRRCTVEQITAMVDHPQWVTLYGRLRDKFGEHGLVSVLAGELDESGTLHLRLWLMSCRVLGRGMENAMFEELLSLCRERGVQTIYGYYFPTEKNRMVERFYSDLGFTEVSGEAPPGKVFRLGLGDAGLTAPTHHIGRTST